ncbi:Oidioi.mRNA.OKI2018_I69.chr2.g4685.t1.cds [Oikopleura dioica]|uniref:Oidioi.mRNA.OKI2018_I69.chr2.g4685.t1.cds n=1 Tax=Oikopleura dioica TaxID=34765 RepID=A0ABN7T3K7_OIKDI|nr:Oidioi.mRNA.OKI2018_I69.chr2.g4685.t1.cds [Oikopleura dioica]
MSAEEKVKCMGCHCTGVLRQHNGNTILFPKRGKILYQFDAVGKYDLKPHGFETLRQRYTYLVLGFIFWQSIILATNFAGLEKLGPKYTFKTLSCGRNYKQCMMEFSYNECYPRSKF